MIGMLYRFKVKPGQDQEFLRLWRAISEKVGDLYGAQSALHLSETGEYVVYAQWPKEEDWQVFWVTRDDQAHEVRYLRLCLAEPTKVEKLKNLLLA